MKSIAFQVFYFILDLFVFGPKYVFVYYKTLSFLRKSKQWNNIGIQNYQLTKLKEICRYAYENVPYYHELFDNNNIQIDNNFSYELFQTIPILTKQIVLEQGDNLLSQRFNKNELVCHSTGGSTGIPAKFYFEKTTCDAREAAFVLNAYRRIGYRRGDRCVLFNGSNDFVTEKMMRNNVFWKYGITRNSYTYSSSLMNPSTIEYYISHLKKTSPKWIIARPSAIYALFKYLGDNVKVVLPRLEGLIFMSESLMEYQKNEFRLKVPSIKMLDIYGHTEHCCFAFSCDDNTHYHIQEEYGYSEFSDLNGIGGELITTSFSNYSMPLIRYRTNDIFTGIRESQCSHHSSYRSFDAVLGRTQDILIFKNKSFVTSVTLDFSNINNDFYSKVLKYQFIQKEVGKCEMLLVLKNQEDIDEIETMVNDYFNSFNSKEKCLEIEFTVVDEIEKSSTGKERIIINKSFSIDDVILGRI